MITKHYKNYRQSKIGIIKQALYGGKSSGSDYWNHMRTCIEHLKFTPCKTDLDVWMRKALKTSNGTEYWEYIILYVNDALCCSMNPGDV